MDFYCVFSNEEIEPIVFDAEDENDARDKLVTVYPKECEDDFEDIEFLATELDLEDELYDYNLCNDAKLDKDYFQRVYI